MASLQEIRFHACLWQETRISRGPEFVVALQLLTVPRRKATNFYRDRFVQCSLVDHWIFTIPVNVDSLWKRIIFTVMMNLFWQGWRVILKPITPRPFTNNPQLVQHLWSYLKPRTNHLKLEHQSHSTISYHKHIHQSSSTINHPKHIHQSHSTINHPKHIHLSPSTIPGTYTSHTLPSTILSSYIFHHQLSQARPSVIFHDQVILLSSQDLYLQ